MKKRILAALLAAVILLTLAGCANNKADAPAPDTTRPTVTTTVETTGTAESDTDTEHTEEKKNSTAEETKPAETTKTQELPKLPFRELSRKYLQSGSVLPVYKPSHYPATLHLLMIQR